MRRFVRQAAVIARRDFLATVATPAFLLFLLAPLFMLLFAVVGGSGAQMIASSGEQSRRIVAIAEGEQAERLAEADERMRAVFPIAIAPPLLEIRAPASDAAAQARALFGEDEIDVSAVLYGPPEAPRVLRVAQAGQAADYLVALADAVERGRRAGLPPGADAAEVAVETVRRTEATIGAQQALGFAALFLVFLLTLLLAGQTVSMLAEEKGNKVIEILAAAVPLEAVFVGKLAGLFGVALLFVGFWGGIAGAGLAMLPAGASPVATLDPAIGLGPFLLLGTVYFAMSYLLMGSVFLGVGAQAGSMREIQMLSLPITFFQMGMFGLASAGAASRGSALGYAAELFPFSSPLTMAARGASDPRLWPHLLAIPWQLLWVTITVALAARAFRTGVLKSGPSPWKRLGRRLRGRRAA